MTSLPSLRPKEHRKAAASAVGGLDSEWPSRRGRRLALKRGVDVVILRRTVPAVLQLTGQ